jgi:fluoride exporter
MASPRVPDRWTVAAVAAGGAIGSPLRYGISRWVETPAGHFPAATLLTNLVACLALGVLVALLVRRNTGRRTRAFLTTGVIGALSTFSTFVVEIDLLVRDGHAASATVYAVATVAGGLLAVWAGLAVVRALAGDPLAEAAA